MKNSTSIYMSLEWQRCSFDINVWYKCFSRATGKVWKIANSAASRSEEMSDYAIKLKTRDLFYRYVPSRKLNQFMGVGLISFERGREQERETKDLFSLVYTYTNQLTRTGKKALCFKDLLHRVTYTLITHFKYETDDALLCLSWIIVKSKT